MLLSDQKEVKALPLPLVSVIVPCYNGAKTIRRTLNSVKAQTLNNLECIVVDDGSTDDSAAVVKDTIKDDHRFQYAYKTNGGVATARNTGVFGHSKGKYICCLDKDDAIAPTFLEVCAAELQKHRGLGITYTGLWYIKPDGSEGLSQWPDYFDYDAMLKGRNQIPTCNVARREVWERLGGQRQRYSGASGAGEEDFEMWLRAGAYGFDAKKVTNDGLFIYSWLSGQVSGNKQHRMVDVTTWHPWCKDDKHPFASLATPKNQISHLVRQYDEPLISVIIPVGPGHEKELINALDSLEAQTFRKWEAIVAWDAGNYNGWLYESSEAFPALTKVYPYVRFIDCGYKTGAGHARNRGAELARAPLLVFLDGDDWLFPEALEKMIEAWEQNDAIIYGDYVGKAFMTEQDAAKLGEKLLYYSQRDKEAVVAYSASDYNCNRALQQPDRHEPYIWNLVTSLVPKAWHKQIGGFDEQMSSWEDWDYWLRMARAGKCFVRINAQLVLYRFYSGGRRERGLQDHKQLLEYLTIKYAKGQQPMPCNCKQPGAQLGQATVSTPQQQAQWQTAVQQTNMAMTDSDLVMVIYTHPNRGDHRVVGMATGKNYGYRGGGDRFLVHKNDIKVQPHLYQPIPVHVDQGDAREDRIEPQPPPVLLQVTGAPVQAALVQAAPVTADPPSNVLVIGPFSLQSLPGVSPSIAMEMQAAGIHTLSDVIAAGVEGLVQLKGIGERRAKTIIDYIKDKL